MLIAIDGPAASGKGTVAKQIAAHYNLEYLDTGRLYRLVGWQLMQKIGVPSLSSAPAAIEISQSLDLTNINSEELETEKVGAAASIVSAIPEVRGHLLDFQRRVAGNPRGAVLDGRDIGTVVCPNADFKFYITAAAATRANRRYSQLKARGKNVTEEGILQDIISRDERDSGRKVAPLVAAIDAIYIDTTEMGVDDVFDKVKNIIGENR